tara:strand:- start:3422 stop:4645 length:1224 start_codon:yes stop_codon:yes gene_type:complete
MTSKVEIGFDLSGDPDLPFFVLDDATKGRLDNIVYLLGGVVFFDVTDKVKSFSISRGKSRQLDRYPAGRLTVEFDNNERTFDPLYTESPYAGQIIPRREVRVSTDDVIQYEGVIDDWNLSYTPNGNSIASVVASDALTVFANQTLTEALQTSQTSGERIIAILDNLNVNWSIDKRDIETGLQTLQADTVADGTNVLEYIQRVVTSEPGAFFIGKNGFVNYKENAINVDLQNTTTFSDDGIGIPYKDIQVIYGSELLYNEVVVNILGGGQAIAVDLASQVEYGIVSLTLDNLLLQSTDDAETMADSLVGKYRQPEYRINSVTVDLETVTPEQRAEILALELNDPATVKFTPNNISPEIDKLTQIIRIQHAVTPTSHNITFGFSEFYLKRWTLSDLILGRLSRGNSLAF